MAFKLEIPKTGSKPCVLIDEERGYLKLEGESFHDNIIEFFAPIRQWLSKHLVSDFTELTFDCSLTYFNSSTAKLLLNILIEMDKAAARGKKIKVNWITSEDNDIIIECGEDFSEGIESLTFNMIIE